MDVNYILIKGNKHFKCHSLAEMAIYFSLSVTSNGIDKKKTLEYAVAFYFYDSGCVNFMMGNIMYQHIKTIYDERADGRGQNTLEVVYNYKKMKYEVLCLTDSKLAQKEISIL